MSDILKVLYVDDEPDIRIIVEMALGLDPAMDVRIAASGAEAMDLIAQGGWLPDMALLDMQMPEMSGAQLLTRMRTSWSVGLIPILFVTASARQQDLDRYDSLGADGVITKPFDPMTLARTVREHYERVKASR